MDIREERGAIRPVSSLVALSVRISKFFPSPTNLIDDDLLTYLQLEYS